MNKLKDYLYYSERGIRLYNANCLNVMQKLPDDYVDLICTDPPYGISFMSKEWDTFNEVKDIQKEFANTVYAKKGFKKLPRNKPFGMIKFFVPIWKEVLRVLKPGAFAFVMCAPRQDVLTKQITALQEAGFRTDFTSIYWTYASGFPKASNIGKKVDKRLGRKRKVIGKKVRGNVQKAKKRGTTFTQAEANKNNKAIFGYGIEKITLPSSKEAKELDGSYGGFQPKPAVEIIIVAMKPLNEKTYIDQALKNGKGITWLDNCRVPYESENDKEKAKFGTQTDIRGNAYNKNRPSEGKIYAKNVLSSQKGRFPANLLVSDDVFASKQDKGTKPHKVKSNKGKYEGWGNITKKSGEIVNYGDKGSYSRYFDLDKWWVEEIKKLPPEVQKVFPYLIVPKASKREKNKGLTEKGTGSNTYNRKCLNCKKWERKQGLSDKYTCHCRKPDWEKPRGNVHPTVKPLKLFSYLITLGSRKNDIIVDPFVGSGTTLIASKILNRKGIGVELSKEYCKIAKHRIQGN